MVFPKARMFVAGALFLGWIAFLIFLVTRTRDPIILSRPQLLVADQVALVKIEGDDKKTYEVVKFLGSNAPVPSKLTIAHLDLIAADEGWRGPGEYIVPLTKTDAGYAVTTLPPVPGYVPHSYSMVLRDQGPSAKQVKEKLAEFSNGQLDVKTLPLQWTLPRDWRLEGKRPSFNETAGFVGLLKALGADIELVGEVRIYRATPDALRQLDSVRKE